MNRSGIFHVLTSWVLYSVLFTVLVALQAFILPIAEEGVSRLDNFLMVDMGRLLMKSLLLSVTGFIIYGFIRIGLGYLPWFNRESRGYVIRILVFYLTITLSMLITHLFAYDRLPLGIVVDLPIFNAIASLIFGTMPYFKRTLFSPQD